MPQPTIGYARMSGNVSRQTGTRPSENSAEKREISSGGDRKTIPTAAPAIRAADNIMPRRLRNAASRTMASSEPKQATGAIRDKLYIAASRISNATEPPAQI